MFRKPPTRVVLVCRLALMMGLALSYSRSALADEFLVRNEDGEPLREVYLLVRQHHFDQEPHQLVTDSDGRFVIPFRGEHSVLNVSTESGLLGSLLLDGRPGIKNAVLADPNRPRRLPAANEPTDLTSCLHAGRRWCASEGTCLVSTDPDDACETVIVDECLTLERDRCVVRAGCGFCESIQLCLAGSSSGPSPAHGEVPLCSSWEYVDAESWRAWWNLISWLF